MECLERLNTRYDRCASLFSDTEMSPDVLEKYKVGLFLREPTFYDVTYKFGGFIAPHRYLIIALRACCLDGIGENTGWGLCIFQAGRILLVSRNGLRRFGRSFALPIGVRPGILGRAKLLLSRDGHRRLGRSLALPESRQAI